MSRWQTYCSFDELPDRLYRTSEPERVYSLTLRGNASIYQLQYVWREPYLEEDFALFSVFGATIEDAVENMRQKLIENGVSW